MGQSSPRLHRSPETVAVAATTTVYNANLEIWLEKCMPEDEFTLGSVGSTRTSRKPPTIRPSMWLSIHLVSLARKIGSLRRLLRYADEFAAVFNRDQKCVPGYSLNAITHLHMVMVRSERYM